MREEEKEVAKTESSEREEKLHQQLSLLKRKLSVAQCSPQIPTLPLNVWVRVGKLFYLPLPQFPHFQNRDNYTYHIDCCSKSSKLMRDVFGTKILAIFTVIDSIYYTVNIIINTVITIFQ